MNCLISLHDLHGPILPVADYAGFGGSFLSGTPLADEFPQAGVDEGRCCLHVIAPAMRTALALDTVEDIKAFLKLPGSQLCEGHKTNFAVTVENALVELLFLILH